MEKNGSCIRNFIHNLKQENWLVKVKMKPWIEISVNIDISILGFYRYIENIGGYFYTNIGETKIIQN